MTEYNPNPTRVWSRVQDLCTYINPNDNYTKAFIPLTNQTLPLADSNYQDKLLYKGNILQYKGNSLGLTKRQKYAQLAKGLGPSRTKVFATQSQTYTNPNTTSLLRVNYNTLPFPNQLVGQPNNISGPFQYDVPNPFDCSDNSLQDGGNLVCGTYANPCTGQIISSLKAGPQCYPSYCSDVPGTPIDLCWNPKVTTWFPRQRYFMNNSDNKWPQGYKGFESALRPKPPILSLVSNETNYIELSWTIPQNCQNMPISSFNIYVNGVLFDNIKNNGIFLVTLYNITAYSNITITSISYKIESAMSNAIQKLPN